MFKYVVCLCKGCCVFYLFCEAWCCRYSCMGSVRVSSCKCCKFASLLSSILFKIACVIHFRLAFTSIIGNVLLAEFDNTLTNLF